MQERLQKYIARCGVCSRRKAEKLIEQARVQVNGKTITQMGYVIDPDQIEVRVDNQVIRPAVDKVYLVLNKPVGYLTTVSDPEGRRTVFDLLPTLNERVFPVGRLDADSEGLLLFTNDGELANRLIHPRYGVKKKYLVTIEGQINPKTVASLERGIVLEDGKTAPAKIRILRSSRTITSLELEIAEGKKRQIRRMFATVGHPVLKLLRIQFGPLQLGNLKSGKYRFLAKPGIETLKKITNTPQSHRVTKLNTEKK
ncbi:MAG: pseudouridine synthase [bacterium]|nr:pseudouridine synthase [bacterium]